VLQYLARYTHRVAISNHRLVDVTDDTVSFRWKDYRHGSRVRTLTLDVGEFLRRFLLHVLPKRFVRIRYFGFLASRCRTPQLAQCRQALAAASAPPPEPLPAAPPRSSWPCPRCGGAMRLIERLTARQLLREALLADILHDTSERLASVRQALSGVALVRASAGGLPDGPRQRAQPRRPVRRPRRQRPAPHVGSAWHARTSVVRTIERT
jgi:hypothetical protein